MQRERMTFSYTFEITRAIIMNKENHYSIVCDENATVKRQSDATC